MKSKSQFILLLIASMVAGYFGGLMSQSCKSASAKDLLEQFMTKENSNKKAVNRTITTHSILRTRKLEIVDSHGRTMEIFTIINGKPGIIFCNDTGKPNNTLYMEATND